MTWYDLPCKVCEMVGRECVCFGEDETAVLFPFEDPQYLEKR